MHWIALAAHLLVATGFVFLWRRLRRVERQLAVLRHVQEPATKERINKLLARVDPSMEASAETRQAAAEALRRLGLPVTAIGTAGAWAAKQIRKHPEISGGAVALLAAGTATLLTWQMLQAPPEPPRAVSPPSRPTVTPTYSPVTPQPHPIPPTTQPTTPPKPKRKRQRPSETISPSAKVVVPVGRESPSERPSRPSHSPRPKKKPKPTPRPTVTVPETPKPTFSPGHGWPSIPPQEIQQQAEPCVVELNDACLLLVALKLNLFMGGGEEAFLQAEPSEAEEKASEPGGLPPRPRAEASGVELLLETLVGSPPYNPPLLSIN